MNRGKKQEEPRDRFTLNLVQLIQEALSSDPQAANAVQTKQEYLKLLDTPLETFER